MAGPARPLVAIADAIDRVLRSIASAAVWLMPVLALVICLDVITRKLGIFIPLLPSSRLQELEWHIHAVLFSLWLGFAYVLNAHPRVDTWSGSQSLRRRARLELAGCLLFGLPYCFLLVRYGLPFVEISFRTGEGPDLPGGIPERWIVKAFFVAGLVLLLLAAVSMALRLVAFLVAREGERVALPLETDAPTL